MTADVCRCGHLRSDHNMGWASCVDSYCHCGMFEKPSFHADEPTEPTIAVKVQEPGPVRCWQCWRTETKPCSATGCERHVCVLHEFQYMQDVYCMAHR